MRDIDYVRQNLRSEEYREKWRDVITTYIFGATGTGKTRSVMDGHGYSNVFAVKNYKNSGLFDGYLGHEVLLLDEFMSGIGITDMNNYLDGYPLTLPARYTARQACYERVYIISNVDLREQYRNEQMYHAEVWRAFLRRIHYVVKFNHDGTKQTQFADDYLYNQPLFLDGLTDEEREILFYRKYPNRKPDSKADGEDKSAPVENEIVSTDKILEYFGAPKNEKQD
jgi:hypothetical protein